MATGGALIGALRVALGLDSSEFERGSRRARDIARRDATAIQKTLSGVATTFKGMIAAAAGTGLVSAAKRALDYASSLGEVAQQLGVTTRDLQVYRFIATQVGVEQAEMDKGLQKLTQSIGAAADGSKKQAAAFRELGVAVQDSGGKLFTAGEVIPRLADSLSKIEDPAKRARLEVALFGKTGQQLDTLLTEGAKGIEAMSNEADRLGLILGDDLIKKADDAADRLSVLSKVLEVELASTVAENADGILVFANAFLALVSGIGDAISWLRKFGYEARQAINTAQGWTPFGGRASGEAAKRARARYFMEGVAWDEEERRRKEAGNTARSARLRPPGDLPTSSVGGGSKRTPPKDRSAEHEARYQDQLGRARVDNLESYAELTGSIEQEYNARMAALAAERASFDREIKLDEHLDAAKRAQLTAERDKHDEIQKQLIEERLTAELARRSYELDRADIDALGEMARYREQVARSASARRDAELAILDLKKREEKAQLELTLATEKTSSAAFERAKRAMDTLDERYGHEADLVRRDTMGPMESWLDSLPRSAEELRESFESIKVDALNNSLDLASRNVLKLKGFAGDLFNQLISDVIRLNLQAALTSGANGLLGSLGKLLGMASGSSGGAGSAAASVLNGIPGFASGGSFRIGGAPGIDRNVLAINGIPRARVSANENITVGYGNGGGGMVFDMRGAVVTEDLLRQMNVIATARSASVLANATRTQQRRLGQRLD